MFRFASRFRCGDTECVVLRKNGRPLIIELPYLDQAFNNGAEPYPEICTKDSGCWIEITDEDYREIESELEWIFGW